MTDYFEVLDEPQRPWLDPGELKEKFHRLSAAHHPDVAGTDSPDFALLNTAYNTLRDPKTRVWHFLELIGHPVQATTRVPADLGGMFMELGNLLQGVKSLETKLAAASSPLAAALLAAEKFAVLERLEKAISTTRQHHEKSLETLRNIDARWESDQPIDALRTCAEQLSYLGRWESQLREAYSRLAI